MTDDLIKAECHKRHLGDFMRKSSCQPCDRAEAGYQFSLLSKKIDSCSSLLKAYERALIEYL